jgi:hypothetical protein
MAYDALGRKAEADSALAIMETHHANVDAYDIATVYASRGDLNRAFSWLNRAYEQRDRSLFWIKVDPQMRNVQSDSRFEALAGKIGLTDETPKRGTL